MIIVEGAPASPFLSPDDRYDPCALVKPDWELGGKALNDPSEGLTVRIWRLTVDGHDLVLDSPDPPAISPQTLLTVPGLLSEVSLAFDQLMSPQIAYVEDRVAKFWYFDTSTQQRETLILTGCTSPRCFLDDKRSTQTGASDVYLVYLKEGALYARIQRERYLEEHVLTETDADLIGNCGMTSGNRVRIDLVSFSA